MIAKKIRATLTSVTVIVIVALALRVAFTWNYVESHSHQALSVIPFMYESADIAVSIAQGHGFSSPFRIPTGPTAWMTPVYPALLDGVFRLFPIYTFTAYLLATCINIPFDTFTFIPII